MTQLGLSAKTKTRQLSMSIGSARVNVYILKRETDSRERIERIPELNIFYYHTLIIDYMI